MAILPQSTQIIFYFERMTHMSIVKNQLGKNYANLFAKHREIFSDYLFYSGEKDYLASFASRNTDLYYLKDANSQRNLYNSPIKEFLDELSLHEVRLLATIKLIGSQTVGDYANHSILYANYQDCLGLLKAKCNSREDYVSFIMGAAYSPKEGDVLTRGLERLGICL